MLMPVLARVAYLFVFARNNNQAGRHRSAQARRVSNISTRPALRVALRPTARRFPRGERRCARDIFWVADPRPRRGRFPGPCRHPRVRIKSGVAMPPQDPNGCFGERARCCRPCVRLSSQARLAAARPISCVAALRPSPAGPIPAAPALPARARCRRWAGRRS